MPDSRIATMSSVVATGRRMKELGDVHRFTSLPRSGRRLHAACERVNLENCGLARPGMRY